MPQAHHEWMAKWQREVAEEYDRLHAIARRDPQQSGHGGESTWVRLLEEWLPPAYSVGSRKYIVPEEGADLFETDIVVFNPGYPERLRDREQVLAGGVAAAFSVKLTLDAAGLKDAVERGARLRRAMKPRYGTPRDQMVGPFAFGVLAHSHSWKLPGSTPRENLAGHLWRLDHEIVAHPRESLDAVCIADLATVTASRMPYHGPDYFELIGPEKSGVLAELEGINPAHGAATCAMSMSHLENEPGTVAMFIAWLIEKLAQKDPALEPYASSLRVTNTLGSSGGPMRFFPLATVFTEDVLGTLPIRANTSPEWGPYFP